MIIKIVIFIIGLFLAICSAAVHLSSYCSKTQNIPFLTKFNKPFGDDDHLAAFADDDEGRE